MTLRASSMTSDSAGKLVQAICDAARSLGEDVSVAVADSRGRLAAFGRSGKTSPAGADVAVDHAWVAVSGGAETWGGHPVDLDPSAAHFLQLPACSERSCGIVIRIDGHLVGGIGVAGRDIRRACNAIEAALSRLEFDRVSPSAVQSKDAHPY